MLIMKNKAEALAVDEKLLKSVLGLEENDSSYDDYLKYCVKKAVSYVEDYTQRTILNTTWEYASTSYTLYLPKPPIQKILSVKSDGVEIEAGKYQQSFTRDNTVLILDKSCYGKKNVVEYEAGYGDSVDDVPTVLGSLIFDCAKIIFDQSETIAKTGESNYLSMLKENIDSTSFGVESSYLG